MHRLLLDSDTLKVLAVGGAGLTTTLTNADLIIKVMVGIITFAYVVVKFVKLLKARKQENDNELL